MGGFKDLGSPPTLSTERDLFGDLDETRQSKLATIKSIVDNPQPAATQMAIAMRTYVKGLGIFNGCRIHTNSYTYEAVVDDSTT